MNSSFDVLVIGSGVMGSSIAYHCARQGASVLVIERSQVAENPVASWASAGGVRRQGRHHAEAQLASEAIMRWPSLSEELEADLHYRQGGDMFLAESAEEAQKLVDFVRQQHAMGFTDVRLLDRKESTEAQPGLSDTIVAASYSPLDGQADPVLTTRAFAQAAERLGATFWLDTQVNALLRQGQHIQGAVTKRGNVQAKHIVLAAGAWSEDLSSSIGLRLPVRTVALQMLLTDPAPTPLLQSVLFTIGRKLSLKQRPDGSFLLGGGWQGTPFLDRSSYILRPEQMEGNWQVACSVFPELAQRRVVHAWCGLEAESIDGIPLIGPVPGWQGLILALGFSGHGFALSPAVGRSVADLIGGNTAPELHELSPERIETLAKQ